MRSVLVIGGGWAGISAAMSAAHRGCKVHLVEERPYLGGRVRSFIDKKTDEEIDNGQHLLMGCYHETRKILETLGTDHLAELQPALSVPFVDQHGVHALDGGGLPGSLGVALVSAKAALILILATKPECSNGKTRCRDGNK